MKLKREEFKKSFSEYPVILQFYNRLYIGLEKTFMSAKTASGKFVDPVQGSFGVVANSLSVIGEFINAIPIFGGFAKLVSSKPLEFFLSKIDQERQKNMVSNISNLGVFDELKKICESTARRLAKMYKD